MSFFELPKPTVVSADSASGSGIQFHADSGFLSRIAHITEKPRGEAERRASYRLGVLPTGEVLASYDIHLPAGTASISMYDNGDDELAADFSIQPNDWSREKIVAEAVFSPRLQSTVIRSAHGLFGLTVQSAGTAQLVELYSLNPDKSILSLHSSLRPSEYKTIGDLRLHHGPDDLQIQVGTNGYRSGITLPFAFAIEPFQKMHRMLAHSNPLGNNPKEMPIPHMGASIRLVRDDIYKS